MKQSQAVLILILLAIKSTAAPLAVSLTSSFVNQAFTITFTDGSYDTINVNAAVDLVFNPGMPIYNGTDFMSSQAQVNGTIHIWGSAAQYDQNPDNSIDFDNTINYSSTPAAVAIAYEGATGNGDLQTVFWQITTSRDPNNPIPYALQYSGTSGISGSLQLWISLPYPFWFNTADECYTNAGITLVTGQDSVYSCLKGRVLDAVSEAPLTGTQVTFGAVLETSDINGMFLYTNIPAQTYQLTSSEPGYKPYAELLTIPAFTIVQKTVSLEGDLTLDGYIYTTGQQPDPNISVTLKSASFTGTASTDSNGHYEFSVLSPGSYTITPTRAGSVFAPLSQLIDLNANTTAQPFVDVGQSLAITSVSDGYTGFQYFLDGVSFPVTFSATVNWGGHPEGSVQFMTPKKTANGSLANGAFIQTLDMGMDLGAEGQLEVQAVSTDGSVSPALIVPLIVMPGIPQINFYPVSGAQVEYSTDQVGWNWDLIDNGLVPAATIPANIPFLGGRSLKLHFAPTVQGTIQQNSLTLEAKFDELTDFEWGGTPVKVSPLVEAKATFTGGQWNWEGLVGLEAELSPEPWTAPFELPLGDILLPMVFKAEANITGSAKLNLQSFSPLGLSGEGEFSATAKGSLFAAVDLVAGIGGYIQGGSKFGVQAPQTPWLDSYTISLEAGISVFALLWQIEKPLYQWTYPAQPADIKHAAGQSFQPAPLGRDYLRRAEYGQFHGGARPPSSSSPLLTNGTLYALQNQVFPFSEPTLSCAGTNCMAAWLYDDPSRAANNRTLLVWSQFDGSSWNYFEPVSDDGTADFHPRLLCFSDGSAAAAWENARTVLPDSAGFTNMVSNLSISVAFYSPQSPQWNVAPPPLTNVGLLRSPLLAGPAISNLMLVWTSNPSNDLEGSASGPNQLWFAQWDGAAWSAPAAFATVPYPLLKYDLAYDGTRACLAMTLDADNLYTNVQAHSLFGEFFENGAWSGLEQLTTNGQPNENPQLALDQSTTNVVLVWLDGNELSSVSGFDFTSREVIASNEFSSSFADFRLAAGTNGQLAILYAEPSENQSDLWAVFYDSTFGVWGNIKQITDDPQCEAAAAAAFFGTNRIIALYDRLDFDNSGTAGPLVTNADLYALDYQFEADLSVETNSLVVSPPNPVPGSLAELQVTVLNLGDQAQVNVPVAFYLGDPSNGGSLIGETEAEGLLTAGSFTNVTIPWQIPTTATALTVFAVVDPNNSLPDDNRLNNSESATFIEANLAIESMTWTPGTNNAITVSVTVINEGVIPSSGATLDVTLGSANGPSLLQTNLSPLDAGQSVQVEVSLDASGLGNSFAITSAINPGTHLNFSAGNEAMTLTVEPSVQNPVVLLGPITYVPANGPEIGLRGLTGQTYEVEGSTNLMDWATVTNVTLTNILGQFVDPLGSIVTGRFYRAIPR